MTTGDSGRYGTTGADPCDGERCGQCSGQSSGCRSCLRHHGERTDWTNPPGRASLLYGRTGHDASWERMRKRLGGADLPALKPLTARAAEPPVDPALALLDGWACVGQVLGFYNERSVNEHYLRTCHERRSALELARLVGYTPRPGVAAETYLSFTLQDTNPEATLLVPGGTRAASVPGPGETMQSYETVEEFSGRPRWNEMRPRLTQTQQVKLDATRLYLEGLATGLSAGDVLVVDADGQSAYRVVADVEVDPERRQTRVGLNVVPERPEQPGPIRIDRSTLLKLLMPPASNAGVKESLVLDPAHIFSRGSYAAYGLLESAYPGLRGVLGAAVRGVTSSGPRTRASVSVMRGRATMHGSTAQPFPVFDPETGRITRYLSWNAQGTGLENSGDEAIPEFPEMAELSRHEIALDAEYKRLLPGGRIVALRMTERTEKGVTTYQDRVDVLTVSQVRSETRNNYNSPARVSVLTVEGDWLADGEERDVRRTLVYFEEEELQLADVPNDTAVAAGDGDLELDGYYEGLRPGRRVIITGERSDLPTPGVVGSELLLVAAVEHRATSGRRDRATGDTMHTILSFAPPQLQFRYKRETVRVIGNVARATHGESRTEVLGNGDPTQPFQQFTLKQGPLTYLGAPTPSGVTSTLEAVVNDLKWHETDNPATTAPEARQYFLRTDGDGRTAVLFGFGARLPSGRDNVRAQYRSGIGAPGNVGAGQISVLVTRPNGVLGVTNPFAATGGADRENLVGIRHHAPIGLSALDRLISAADVEDFARAFAGIAKARVAADDLETVPKAYVLTVAGVDDAPLPAVSAPRRNLAEALVRFGNLDYDPEASVLTTRGTPTVTIEIRSRRALLLGIRATVQLRPDHLWEDVMPRIRAALLREFGFAARELGQPLHPDKALAVMESVRGVEWAALQAFGTIDTGTSENPDAPKTPADVAEAALELLRESDLPVSLRPQIVGPSEIAYLSDTAPGTLLLVPR